MAETKTAHTTSGTPAGLDKTDAEWRADLGDLAWRVTRHHATEPAFSHPGFPKTAGVFRCVCCGAELFEQDGKYESGCGWPAFYKAKDDAPIAVTEDLSHGMRRLEVHCDACAAHLGHVFPDGPEPTGIRYCINGVALKFEPK